MKVAIWRVYLYHRMGGREDEIGFVIASAEDMDWRKRWQISSIGCDIVKYLDRKEPKKMLQDFSFEEMWTVAGGLQGMTTAVANQALQKMGLSPSEAAEIVKMHELPDGTLRCDRRSIAMAILNARALSKEIEERIGGDETA